jgi:hypothetical protein
MKPKPITSTLALIFAGFLVYLGTHALAQRFLIAKPEKESAVCSQGNVTHFVNIYDGVATPKDIVGKMCERLTIINHDDRIRLIAFGVHDKHQTYDGFTQKALAKEQSLTVTLNQAGTYRFHDHIDDQAQGTFTVTN